MALPVISSPAAYDLAIVQGSTLKRTFQVVIASVIQDLTGCTASAKIRDLFTGGSLVQALTCSISTVSSQSTITVSLTVAQTAALTVPAGTPADSRKATIGKWDLELTDGTDTYRIAEGDVTLSRENTY